MSNEKSENIIAIDKAKHNKLCNRIEKILSEERKRQIEIGEKIFENAQRNSRVATYIRCNTYEKAEEFYLHVYQNRFSYKNGGMLYV